jgi:hypothetical protein
MSVGVAVSAESRLKLELAAKDALIQDAYSAIGEQQAMIADLMLAVAMIQAGGDV